MRASQKPRNRLHSLPVCISFLKIDSLNYSPLNQTFAAVEETARGTNYKTNYLLKLFSDMKQYRVTFDLNVSQNKESLNLLKAFIKCIGEVEVIYCSSLVHIDTDDKLKMQAIKKFNEVWNKL